jgi:outer membrane biogenesis lipoprotein LolB
MKRPINRILVLAALLAAAALPATSRPAHAKGPQKTDYTINTDQDVGCWGDFGRFRASGAVKDHGHAATSWVMYPDYDLVLNGRHGSMMILLEGGTEYVVEVTPNGGTTIYEDVSFLIVDATGDYVSLIGSGGSASAIEDITDGYDNNGDCQFGTIRWTLQGTLP